MSRTKENMEDRHMVLDPESFGGSDFPDFPTWSDPYYQANYDPLQALSDELRGGAPVQITIKTDPQEFNAPLVTPEEQAALDKFYGANPKLRQPNSQYEIGSNTFAHDEPWIQTYSGARFNPTNPVVGAIVIQDIAHSLSMQCRFSGHVKKFYSVAQHSVLVSYICDSADALWGLLHDASEAYLVDVPRPLKQSGKFQAYIDFEKQMQDAICERFGLPKGEPVSVKKADKVLLATEARDLMSPLHPDWRNADEPLPFKIDPLGPQEAKNLFMKRFYELTKAPKSAYAHYLSTQT